jgi:hypothetical protein
MKRLAILFICAFVTTFSRAQNTNISGTINTYSSVTTVSGSTITIPSTAGFSVGDRVLLIQMQGATIDETNSAAFGDFTSMNDAGNYEFATICDIPNNTDIVVNGIQRTYSPSGNIQLVHVPVYNDATITGTLTAASWDGSTGGILAFECTGTLTMNNGIDLQGSGFRGGAVTTSSYSCAWFSSVADYHYDISTGEGAHKGEGIALYISGKTGGRGAQANGGGGGNDHNSGGGGGSNAGTGGLGGERIRPSTFTCAGSAPGVGGKLITYSNADDKIFLGGGGGAGHENNPSTATPGSNGGGIVIIKANAINGNGETINVQGESLQTSSADGAGGGGGGGTVLLDVSTYASSLIVHASGGDGGNVSNVGPSNCNGPGGGGGGGVLWVTQGSVPGNIAFTSNGGANGTTIATTQGNCTLNGANNATIGTGGTSVTGLTLFDNNCNLSPINQSTSICEMDSIFLAGAWQFTAGVYNDTITSGCCDTIYVTSLTVIPSDATNDVITTCDSIIWIDGNTYTASNNTATHTLTNIAGCDSIITLDLTINTVDLSVTQSGGLLTANESGATYQWIDCPGMTPINGATGQAYTATANGDYAVIVTNNGCTDTSACYTVTGVGVLANNFENELLLYPNPTSGILTIEFGNNSGTINYTVTSVEGKTIRKSQTTDQLLRLDLTNESNGIYFLIVNDNKTNTTLKIIKR